jgi:putative NADH-flavin reductase
VKKVAILGAGGQIARWVVDELAGRKDVHMTLFLRRANRLNRPRPENSTVIQGDVLKPYQLDEAVAGQKIVYANLTGEDVDRQAEQIVRAMAAASVARLIFVASLGIYDERVAAKAMS